MSEEVKDIQTEQSLSSQTSSYRSIFKATSLFGGVQVYQILIGIIKSKVIAMLLGPMGVGVLGLFTSANQLLSSVTTMGLQSSAVRDISEANIFGEEEKISKTVAILKRLVLFTGLLGMVAMMVLSPVLSKVTFGDFTQVLPFILYSLCMLFDQLWNGHKIILQGLRRLKTLAVVTATGSTIGLLVSIPIYYWSGVDGIVPSLVITSAVSVFITWIITRKMVFKPHNISVAEALKGGSAMLKLGIAMSVSGIVVTLSSYAIRSFIRYQGGVDEVGLFTAGFILMNTYTGLVFTAMGTDFFPRLAAVNKDNEKCIEIINQQGEIGILILLPLLLVCMVFVPQIVSLLYSNEFMATNGYILWSCCGMLFKMASWAISYVYIAKAEAKLFAGIEIISNVISLAISIIGYVIGGITGLGVAFSIGYVIYLVIVYSIAYRKYHFVYNVTFCKLFLFGNIFIATGMIVVLLLTPFMKYIIGLLLIVGASFFSLRELNKRIEFINIVNRYGKGK